MSDTPERFREVEPLSLPDWTAHAAFVTRGIYKIGDVYCMLIRLRPMTTNPWVLPVARIKLGVGRRNGVAADAQQRAKGVERIKPSVKSERELIEVRLQMLRRYAVMTAAQPAFQVGENQVDDGQVFLGHRCLAALGNGQVRVAFSFQRLVAVPGVRDDHAAGVDGSLYEAAQGLGSAIRDDLQAQASRVASAPADLPAFLGRSLAHFHGCRHKRLVMDASTFAARRAADPCLINLDVIGRAGLADAVPIRSHHTGAELVQNLKGSLVPAQSELALELGGAHAGRVAGDEIRRPKPRGQRRMRARHDRPCRESNISAAGTAAQDVRLGGKAERLAGIAAVLARKALFPADIFEVLGAGCIVREEPLKLRQGLRERQIGMLVDVRDHT